ncbi:MAG: NAD(P)-binding protein, partial [Pseudomonadales bacterium]|nr:NAD(P)-binding protein [Pseudomonadales bacterium]
AWFLDGFAPDRNPEMWHPDLFKTMHTVTKTGGSVTTFSAAGRVRSGLQEAGFNVQRVEGQNAQKRHTTMATFNGNGYSPARSPTYVRVVGGGLAGSTIAQTFARKGVHVELCERAGGVGSATSAIPAAIQHPRLSARAIQDPCVRARSSILDRLPGGFSYRCIPPT